MNAGYDFHITSKVLSLYGIQTLAIDGNVSFEKRAELIARFHEPKSERVFIFSTVGSAGLNLAIADVVIFFVRDLIQTLHYEVVGNRAL